MSSDLSAFQGIEALTKDALLAFKKREVTLKELSINEVYPVIEDIANRLISGPIDEDARYLLIKDIQWVQSQLFLRKTLKKKSEILKKSKRTIRQIESIAVCRTTRQGLESLGDKISIGEKTELENLINKLEDAIKQKNYAVMKELNEVYPMIADIANRLISGLATERTPCRFLYIYIYLSSQK